MKRIKNIRNELKNKAKIHPSKRNKERLKYLFAFVLLFFTLCARICFYYRSTSNICMRRRLNVCHNFCSTAPKRDAPPPPLHRQPISICIYVRRQHEPDLFPHPNLFHISQLLCGHANRSVNISHFTEFYRTKGPDAQRVRHICVPPAFEEGVQFRLPTGQKLKTNKSAFQTMHTTQLGLLISDLLYFPIIGLYWRLH